MKRIAIFALAAIVLLGLTTTAIAKEAPSPQMEIDASLVVASAPASGFDTGLGMTFGVGAMVDKNLQVRGEISYFSWSATEFGVSVDYTRVPVYGGVRYFIPTQDSKLKVYVEGGLEISFDSVEVANPFFGRSTESDVHLGLVPGAGIEVKLNPNLGILAGFRWHLITDDYLTFQGGLAYHF
jgi:opacity protein-like surface antigen